MNILVVEDDKSQSINIKATINKTYPAYNVLSCYNYRDAKIVLDNNLIGIFLLDIDLGEGTNQDGIALAKYIRSKKEYINAPILFLTSIPTEIKTAINEIHCYSYLLKPYSEQELLNSFSSLQNTTLIPPPQLEIRDPNGIYYHLNPEEILYTEVLNHKLIIYTETNTFHTNSYTISSFCRETNNLLTQCHKSYAVNPNKIVYFSSASITIALNSKTITIPIGRKYKEKIYEVLSHE